jgi:hypothetical protein
MTPDQKQAITHLCDLVERDAIPQFFRDDSRRRDLVDAIAAARAAARKIALQEISVVDAPSPSEPEPRTGACVTTGATRVA